jgi:CheY-like chemotaxis protein
MAVSLEKLNAESLQHGHTLNAPLECQPTLDDLHVLVVDDEQDARELLVTVLERCGAAVVAVATAKEALAALAKRRPDILVSDIGMPDEDGYDLIRKVRLLTEEQGGSLPAVALTAYAGREDRQRALEAGFQMHLSKPVDPTELAATISNLVRSADKV